MEASNVLIIVGTRPEGIKMMPVYFALKRAGIPTLLISTGQHTDLLNEVFAIFNVTPDVDLALGKPNQDPAYLTHAVLTACTDLYKKLTPSFVLVQGDTTTIMAAALAAFYLKIPVGHVEAGLRTGDMHAPFPEELNRRVVSLFADYHFAPTLHAINNLGDEKIPPHKLYQTGNTVVDALHYIRAKLAEGHLSPSKDLCTVVSAAKDSHKKIVLLTAHRRESFGAGLRAIMSAVKELALKHPEVVFIYPTHPNPAVQTAIADAGLDECKNIHTFSPLPHIDLVYVLLHADVVLTDSGGIQEEAISLGKPVLILREKTERPEGIWAGLAELVGTNKEKIITMTEKFLRNEVESVSAIQPCAIYGDGKAAERIASIISEALNNHINKGVAVCKNVSA